LTHGGFQLLFANLKKRRSSRKQMTRHTRLTLVGIGIGLLLSIVIGAALLLLNRQGRFG